MGRMRGLSFNVPFQRGARGSRRVHVTIYRPYAYKDGDVQYEAIKVPAWRRDEQTESYEDEQTARLNFDSIYSVVWSEYWSNLFRNHQEFSFVDEYGVEGTIKYVRNMGEYRPFIEVFIERDASPRLDLPDEIDVLSIGGHRMTIGGHPIAL